MSTSHDRPLSFQKALLYCALIIVLLFLIFPVYYMVITSIKTPGEAYRLPPTLWPMHPTLDAYPYMFGAWGYWQTLINTIVVAGLSALGATLLGGMAAYAFSRLSFLGKTLMYSFMVGSIAVPGMVTLGPIF